MTKQTLIILIIFVYFLLIFSTTILAYITTKNSDKIKDIQEKSVVIEKKKYIQSFVEKYNYLKKKGLENE